MTDFSSLKEKMFYVLCFAICTPQTKYINNKKVNIALIENDFYNKSISREELEKIIKPVRFYRNKTRYLLEAKERINEVLEIIASDKSSEIEKRNRLADKFNGIGMKVASEFMRDIGYHHLAIIDVHIARYMNKPVPKSKKEYLEMEKDFCEIAKKQNILPGALDRRVWNLFSGEKGGN